MRPAPLCNATEEKLACKEPRLRPVQSDQRRMHRVYFSFILSQPVPSLSPPQSTPWVLSARQGGEKLDALKCLPSRQLKAWWSVSSISSILVMQSS